VSAVIEVRSSLALHEYPSLTHTAGAKEALQPLLLKHQRSQLCLHESKVSDVAKGWLRVELGCRARTLRGKVCGAHMCLQGTQ
jgi:hypothetical protein